MNRWTLGTAAMLALACIPAAAQVAGAGGDPLGDYGRFAQGQREGYDKFKDEYLRRYNEFRRKVLARWGVAEISSQHTLVRYSDDLDEKIVVDYENNQIRVEALVQTESSGQPDLPALAREAAMLTVARVQSSDPVLPIQVENNQGLLESAFPGGGRTIEALAAEAPQRSAPVDVSPDAERRELAAAARALPSDTPAEVVAAARRSVSEGFAEARSARAERSTVHALTIQLPPAATVARAKAYFPFVRERAKAYALDPALVAAIAHTESSFNPAARSAVPAFGLMQIVPRSAGRDVNAKLNHAPADPTPESLYDPPTNIAFGSGYLFLLTASYFKDIGDPIARLYCAIAAYNTGPGNVARVFHPERRTKMAPAIAVINGLPAAEVRDRLVRGLPYEETRRYLVKVSERLPSWSAALAAP